MNAKEERRIGKEKFESELNSSVEARAFGSSDSTLSAAAGGGGGPGLVLRNLRMSKNCWTCSVVTICGDGWFVGNV